MRVSAKTDYALRVLLILAQHAPALVKLDVLTAGEAMPRKFVESILGELRRAGLVASRRGSDGGYALAVPPGQVTVGAVIRVVEGVPAAAPRSPRGGDLRGGGAEHGPASRLEQVWSAVSASVEAVLDGTTLEHLLTGQLPEHVRRMADADVAATPMVWSGVDVRHDIQGVPGDASHRP
jgi:Rrf2 family protein